MIKNNPELEDMINKIKKLCSGDSKRYLSINGSAGTGKTYTITRLIKDLIKN